MSSGMMDVARHGIMQPSNFSFYDVMTIFLAVMVTDIIVLDMFNTLGMPTSTTVSLVFELLGGTFILAVLKVAADPNLAFSDLLNTDKALSVIIAIFVSVAIAFVFGIIVQWLSRIVFTFNYKRHSRYSIAIFGGIAFTALAYFIFLKGIAKSHYIAEDVRTWVEANTDAPPCHFRRLVRRHGGAPSAPRQHLPPYRPYGNICPRYGIRRQRPRQLHRRASRRTRLIQRLCGQLWWRRRITLHDGLAQR